MGPIRKASDATPTAARRPSGAASAGSPLTPSSGLAAGAAARGGSKLAGTPQSGGFKPRGTLRDVN